MSKAANTQSDTGKEPGAAEHAIIHGDGKPTSEVDVAGAHKTAPFPEGASEMHDEVHSGGGSRGVPATGSGKGGHEPKTLGENKGLNA